MKHARPDYNRIQDPENKIPEDEPVFILRAQDHIAAMVVRVWAELNELCGGDPILSDLAMTHAQAMEDWPKKKPADFKKPTPIDAINECLHAKHLDCHPGGTTMKIGLPLTAEDIYALEKKQDES